MIRVTGSTMKSEIANAIHEYNQASIYSYGDAVVPTMDCYFVDSKEVTVQKFCGMLLEELAGRENKNTIPMIVVYTNESEDNKIKKLESFANTCEVYGYVGTVVLMIK